jgi:hypothetical protein
MPFRQSSSEHFVNFWKTVFTDTADSTVLLNIIFQTQNIWAGCHGNRHLLQIFCNIFHHFLWHFKKIDNISWILRLCISCQFKSLQRMGNKHGWTYYRRKKNSMLCKHRFPCNTLTHSINEDHLNIKRKGDPEVSYPLSYVRYHLK